MIDNNFFLRQQKIRTHYYQNGVSGFKKSPSFAKSVGEEGQHYYDQFVKQDKMSALNELNTVIHFGFNEQDQAWVNDETWRNSNQTGSFTGQPKKT